MTTKSDIVGSKRSHKKMKLSSRRASMKKMSDEEFET